MRSRVVAQLQRWGWPILYNLVPVRVAKKRFAADKAITDSFVQLPTKAGEEEK